MSQVFGLCQRRKDKEPCQCRALFHLNSPPSPLFGKKRGARSIVRDFEINKKCRTIIIGVLKNGREDKRGPKLQFPQPFKRQSPCLFSS